VRISINDCRSRHRRRSRDPSCCRRHLSAVAAFTRACAYDRAGLGWSAPARTPRTVARMIAELRGVLANVTTAGPAVLVGHSFGAFYIGCPASTWSRSGARIHLGPDRGASQFRPRPKSAKTLSISSANRSSIPNGLAVQKGFPSRQILPFTRRDRGRRSVTRCSRTESLACFGARDLAGRPAVCRPHQHETGHGNRASAATSRTDVCPGTSRQNAIVRQGATATRLRHCHWSR
jgi:hypothetical protein